MKNCIRDYLKQDKQMRDSSFFVYLNKVAIIRINSEQRIIRLFSNQNINTYFIKEHLSQK